MGRSIDRALVAMPVLAVSVAWIATASKHVLGGDNGEFATLAVTGGAAHAPGYPLVAMVLHALRWLPGTSPAHASSLGNALVAITGLAAVARACVAWRASRAAVAIACVAWALAPTTWALATEAEVFAANALFAAFILWLAAPDPPLAPATRAVALALIAGLALTNNYTIGALAPLGLHACARAVRASKRPALVVVCAFVALLAGASPYAFLFVAARRALDPASWSWGYVHDWRSLLIYLSRSDYHEVGLTSFDHIGMQTVRVTTELAALPLVALAGAALWVVRHRGRVVPRATLAPWLALVASIMCAGPAFMAVFHVPLEGPGVEVTRRFDLLPMTLSLPCIARALDELFAPLLARPVVALAAPAAVFTLLFGRSLPAHRAHQRPGVELYADNALIVAPDRAIILGTGDARLGSFLYARYARGARPDVAFVNPRLLLAPWYHARIERVLGMKLPEVREHALDVVALIDALLATGRPLFVTDWFSPNALGRYPSYPLGPLVRIVASIDAIPSPDDVERANLAVAARFAREPLPLPGPEPWSDGLAADYARPWDALAQMFARRGDEARSAANVRRAGEARAAAGWP